MSLSDIWFLYRARVRARAVIVQEGFAITGIAVGVALLFASQVAATSLTHSVRQLTRQLVGQTQFQLDARGPEGMDERIIGRALQVPGVKVALPVLEQQATIGSAHGERSVDLIGTDPRFAQFAGQLLRRFSAKQLAAQHMLALPVPIASALKVGSLETVRVQIGSRSQLSLLGATLGHADIGGLADSPVAVAPIRYAQQLAGLQGRVSRVFIQVSHSRERQARESLRQLAASAAVNFQPASFDSRLFSVAAAPATQSQTLFSAISALVGFMFALNAMLMTVPSRRRLVEDVRRQGATRWMTVQILAFDAAVLGVLACALGIALGQLLSVAVFHTTPGYLSSAFPVGNQRVVTWGSVALAVAAGFAAAALGVCWPLRDLIVKPLHAVEEHLRPWSSRLVLARMALGVACLAGTAAVLLARPQSAVLGTFTLVVALLCLLPAMFDGVVNLCDRLQRPFSRTSPLLAVTELRTPQTRIRSLAIAATGAVAVFGVAAIQGAQINLEHGLAQSGRAVDSAADVWLTPGKSFDTFAAVPFEDVASKRIARLPGVRSVSLYRGGFLDWGDRRLWVMAPSADGGQVLAQSQLVSGALAQASARVRSGGWAVLSARLAEEHHLRLGERFQLPSPRPVTLRVAALSTNYGWAPGAIVMSAGDYARAWGSPSASAYEVQLQPGIPAQLARTLIRQATAATGFSVETAAERMRRHNDTTRQSLSRLTQIRVLVLIAAVLAVTGAMGAMIWQRRDLVAFIKCQGYSRGVLWRWLFFESAILLGAGCLIGTVFGLFGQLLISHALAAVTGFPIVIDVGPLVALLNFALVTVAAVAIVSLAGFLVVRVPPRTVSPAY